MIIVGHVPREISYYIWYAIYKTANFEAEVYDVKPKLTPLKKVGLKIVIKVRVTWDACEKPSILINKVKEVEYLVTGDYIHASKNTLLEFRGRVGRVRRTS